MKWAVMETRSVTTRSEAARHGQKDRQAGRQSITVMTAWTRHDKQRLMKTVVSGYLIQAVAPLDSGTCF